MPPELILALVKMTLEVIDNHKTRPSPEQIAAEINSELIKGKAIIDQWFAEKGKEPPK